VDGDRRHGVDGDLGLPDRYTFDPEQYRDPVLLAGIGTLSTTLASIVGAYNAPANAVPVK
jgi:hypothetical protein